jgi:putative ABC transport system permease protein
MFNRDTWLEIANTVMSHPMRTFLTGLSIALGVFILVVMQGLGFGLQNGVKSQFADDAVNSVWVRSGRTQLSYRGNQPNRKVKIREMDVDAMFQQMDTVEVFSRRIRIWGVPMEYGDKLSSFPLRGVDPGHQELENTTLTGGRYISQRDIDNERKVAVVGKNIIEDLYEDSNPVGTYLMVQGIQFMVVGTFNDPASRWENRMAYLPYSTAQRIFRNKGAGDVVDQIIVGTGSMPIPETTSMTATLLSWFKDRKGVHPDDSRGIIMENNNEEYARFQNIFMGIELFIWGIGLLTLLAGAVGVANILAIAVKERTKEIGVRKALGATSSSVVALVVQESLALMIVSGSAGLVVGVWLLELVSPMVDHEYFKNPQVDYRIALLAISILAVVGVLSGIGPAIRAVSIKPVEALRDE